MTFWRVCSRTEGVQQDGGCAAGRGWRVCSRSGGCAVSVEGVQEVRRVCSQFIPVCRVPMQ